IRAPNRACRISSIFWQPDAIPALSRQPYSHRHCTGMATTTTASALIRPPPLHKGKIMNKNLTFSLRAAICGIAGAAVFGTAHADQIVKIGEAAPITGPASYLGKDTENGAR